MSRIPAVLAVIGVAVALAGCARAPDPGPAERGQEVYDRVVEIGGNQEACSNCHRLDSGQTSGPSFQGLGARAGERPPARPGDRWPPIATGGGGWWGAARRGRLPPCDVDENAAVSARRVFGVVGEHL